MNKIEQKTLHRDFMLHLVEQFSGVLDLFLFFFTGHCWEEFELFCFMYVDFYFTI